MRPANTRAQEVPPKPKATLLLASDVPCTVKLDGEKVAELQPDAPAKLLVVPGQYLLAAVSADGQRWSKAVTVKGPKTVIKIEFAQAAASPVQPASTIPATPTLVLASDMACTVKLDGEKVADLEAGIPKKIDVGPGQYFVSASTPDGQRWTKAVDVTGTKVLVKIEFAQAVADSAKPASKPPPTARIPKFIETADPPRIEFVEPTLAQAVRIPTDPLTGRWEVFINPGSRRGIYRLVLDGTLVSGDYVLDGGFRGSLRGTFIGDRMNLKRNDAERGFDATFYGRLTPGPTPAQKRILGTWAATTIAPATGPTIAPATGPTVGTWSALPSKEPEESEKQ